MITVAACGWTLTSLLTGVAHSMGIQQAARNPQGWAAALGMMRLGAVGLVLTAAAIWGQLFPAAAGWLVGFAVSLALLWRSHR